MADKPKKKSKYAVVIPTKDWVELSEFQRMIVSEIVRVIDKRRKEEGSNPLSENRYIICNQDEPYASKVWDIILNGEQRKNKDNGATE